MIIAVADTGPLIHLDEIDALDSLSVVDELLIPRTVYEELKAGTVPPALGTIEYELEYRLNDSNNTDYTINTYERKNGSYELVTTSVLTGHEPTYKNDLSPPWDPGAERIYQLIVVRTDSETVVAAVTITLERDEG